MKTIIVISALFLPQFVQAESFWDCQCFESEQSSTGIGGIRIFDQSSLEDAEKIAATSCKKSFNKKKSIVRCLHFVHSDH